ncbi:GNAT family N-acetyltransferase [Niveibacterium sp. SC-1]|uniref:GNAT family N-acetyltransferase n=1 Tax=Niveibacterium sp. SC-1 TaxID=3135646 RepID=UPI00311F56EC
MPISLRPAIGQDFEFAFEAKRQALGPHILARWNWDESFQLDLHRQRWGERPWSIIEASEVAIGTSIWEREDHIRFGEFYLLPSHQPKGIGSSLLGQVIARSDEVTLPIRLQYLKWNPVGALYRRHGFKLVSENEIHYFLEREPSSR